MNKIQLPPPLRTLIAILVKALVLFVIAILVFGLVQPLPLLEKATLYNWLIPGRPRLPFGENPDKAYNFTLNSLDAMFASHEVNRPKAKAEFRVLVVGDSSVWGTLLRPEETLTGALNRQALTAPDGRSMRFYNLGYPTISLTKDLLLLNRLERYQPDAILWLTTLEAFPTNRQLD
jgi:hypothetical protein